MKMVRSLSAKIWLLAFLNVLLLGILFVVFARFQLRVDLSSFLFAPARDRIISVSRLIALQLPNAPQSSWSQLLAQYSGLYPAEFFMFEEDGRQLAGSPVSLPSAMTHAVHHQAMVFRPSNSNAGRMRSPRPQAPPPLILARTSSPALYWIGVHVPIWRNQVPEPIHAVLIWRFTSLWTNPFFFDYRPWVAAVVAIVLISVVCWLPLIRGLTTSISRMTQATAQIAEGHFEVELPVNRRDELGRLSESINQMAHRLSGFVHGQRRFLGDIAHELCSPIARIQFGLGILEQRAQENHSEYVSDVREEVEHMSGLINELLAFSKSQIKPEATQLSAVNVADTVRRVIERERFDGALVETRVKDDLQVLAQPDFLFRSIANLVRNAIRYAGQAGPILVSARNGTTDVVITVADNGPGLPEGELENVFKPFYRPEFARQRETGGSGLGLAIVRSCIESCGGAVKCRNRTPQGLEVEIRLPLVPH